VARKRNLGETPPEPELLVAREEAAAKLDDRIAKGRDIFQREVRSVGEIGKLDDDYDKWNAYNSELLLRLFTTDKLSMEYRRTGALVVSMVMGEPSHAQRVVGIKGYISAKISALESIKERLELFPIAVGVRTAAAVSAARERTNRAFIVHGHDEAVREKVARLLQRLGVEPIILHEQASEGRTLIEKLEHYSDVDFAVVLLTPDDVGSSKQDLQNLQPRARQNVILELGYFAGMLGRKRVCALFQGPLETPTDYVGVVYVPLDSGGGWQLTLARELRAAGFDIDLNAL